MLERISSRQTIGAQHLIQNLEYQYDGVNNLTDRTDHILGSTETFNYDDLHRLTHYNRSAAGETKTVAVTYDALGNITSKSDVGTYNYDAIRPNRLDSVTQIANNAPELDLFKVNWAFDGNDRGSRLES